MSADGGHPRQDFANATIAASAAGGNAAIAASRLTPARSGYPPPPGSRLSSRRSAGRDRARNRPRLRHWSESANLDAV